MEKEVKVGNRRITIQFEPVTPENYIKSMYGVSMEEFAREVIRRRNGKKDGDAN